MERAYDAEWDKFKKSKNEEGKMHLFMGEARMRCVSRAKNEFERRFYIHFAGRILLFSLQFALKSNKNQTQRDEEKWERERFMRFPNYKWFIVLFPFDQIKIITNAKN